MKIIRIKKSLLKNLIREQAQKVIDEQKIKESRDLYGAGPKNQKQISKQKKYLDSISDPKMRKEVKKCYLSQGDEDENYCEKNRKEIIKHIRNLEKLEEPIKEGIGGVKNTKLFYIGERHNPQFDKPYYVAFGQLSKAEAKKKEGSIYGSMNLTSYQTEQEYKNKIESLKKEGYRVTER